MDSSNWQESLNAVIDDWARQTSRKIIISPDVDGITSACILNSIYEVEIIGIYTSVHLQMLGEYNRDDAKNALWLDHDINKEGIRCIGQHLVQHKSSDTLPLRDPRSWNPNVWVGQSWEESFKGIGGRKRDKFPFGTAHFLWDLNNRNAELTPAQLAVLAHADGTWFAADCYKANASIWRDLMFSDSSWIEKILSYRSQTSSHKIHRELCADLEEIGYKSQSRSQKAKLLPDELKSMVGHQSLTIRLSSDANKYLKKIETGIQLISSLIGSTPAIGTQPGLYVSGNRELIYPNRIKNFDELMVEEEIFSHAFTDFRSLSYTVGLDI